MVDAFAAKAKRLLDEYDSIKGTDMGERRNILAKAKNLIDKASNEGVEKIRLRLTKCEAHFDIYQKYHDPDGAWEKTPCKMDKRPSGPFEYFAHESFRPGQKQGYDFIRKSAQKGKVLLLDSPTGCGKTAMALSGLLSCAKKDEKVAVLTRTHSQYDSFLREAADINRMGHGIKCGLLMGKQKICPVGVSRFRCAQACKRSVKEMEKGTSSSTNAKALRQRVSGLRRGVIGSGCPYFNNTYLRDPYGKLMLKKRAKDIVKRQHESPMLVDEFLAACDKPNHPICPYEAMKSTLPKARILILHYLYLIDAGIYDRVFEWIGQAAEKTHALIDEAHNIREIIIENNRRSFPYEYLSQSLDILEKGKEYDLSRIKSAAGAAADLISSFDDEIRVWLDERSKIKGKTGEETLILDSEKTGSTMWLLHGEKPVFSLQKDGVKSLERVAGEISAQFEAMAESQSVPDSLDRPQILDIADVLGGYFHMSHDRYVKCIKLNHTKQSFLGSISPDVFSPVFSVQDIDPRDIMGKLAANLRSLTLMSGTLHPTRLFEKLLFYEDIGVCHHRIGNPFPKENRKTYIVDDFTSSYSRRNDKNNIASAKSIISALAGIRGNVGLFFPSYAMAGYYSGTCHDLCKMNRKRLLEEHDCPDKSVLLRNFKSASNAMITGVCRGSLSEGIDYPGSQMVAVAVFGVPLAVFSKYQLRVSGYYTKRGMDGETLTYSLPAVIAATQALGRCIRGEKDRGLLILADNRYLMPKYRSLLPDWISSEAKTISSAKLRRLING